MAAQPADRIRGEIDGRRTVPLAGNRHPLASPHNDLGAAPPETRMERMILVLASSDAQQLALAQLLTAQTDPKSPQYHRWLTPAEFEERFGASQHDLARLTAWLAAQRFTVDEIPAGGRTIIFSGSAADVEAAFHTPIHRYLVNGEARLANAADPQIPEALAGIVAGISTLHNFPRRALHSPLAAAPEYSAGGSYYLAPGDFAAIYDVASLYNNGINGAGQAIAIVARCNIPTTDAQTFRQTVGLPVNNPVVIVNGPDPGVISLDELAEADLDSQWSGAVAPQATVDFVVSASTNSTDGVDLSAQYIVSNNVAGVMSTSFGSCEQYMGSTELTFYNNLWQQAAGQGITALISAGDSGAAGCDSGGESTATGGAGVNGLCSTPYSVCVGGTEFNEGANPGQYWSVNNNATTMASALGYIPETVWNDSGSNGGSGLWAGGGGASAYYSKPAWQTGPGVPADGKRDVPDVSLTASGAHDGYIFEYALPYGGGLSVIGGTSASAPSFAGLMALVNQQTGSRQGNANTTLYALATLQGAGGRSYFHDITTGNNTVPGVTGFNAVTGYDQSSGLGSVDAATLVTYWTDATNNNPASFALNASPASLSVTAGTTGSVTAQITVISGFNAPVTFSTTGLPTGVTAQFSPATLSAPGSGSSSATITVAASATPGTYPFQIVANGGLVTQTFGVSLTVAAPLGCALTSSPTTLTMNTSSSSTTEVSCGSLNNGFKSSMKLAVSGLPQGVTASLSASSLTPGTGQSKLTVTASATAPTGSYTLSVTATGGGLVISLSLPLTINPAPSFTLGLNVPSTTVVQGTLAQVTATTATVGTFNSPVALSVSGVPSGVTAAFLPASVSAPGSGSGTLCIQASSSAAAGAFSFTIKATGGGVTKSVTLPVTIQLLPGFTLKAAQSSLTLAQTATGAFNITVSSLVGGFSAPVALSIAPMAGGNLPAGLNANFTPATIASPGSGTSILSFTPSSSSATGTFALTITASGGEVTRTAALSLTVTPPPSFTLKPAAATLSALVGGTVSTQISATAAYGFSSTVTFSTSKLPTGVTASFAPTSASGNNGKTTITLDATSSAVPGSYTVTVSATGGGVTATTPVTLNIGKMTVTPQSAAVTVKHGSSVKVTVNTSLAGTYSGTATLSASGLPKGVTAAFSPSSITNPASGSSTLTLTAASSAALGTQTITVSAGSSGQTSSANISLTVQ